MLSTPSSSGIYSFSVSSPYRPNPGHGSEAGTGMSPNYDFSSFSTVTDSHNRFQMDLVSRLSREVRTATTTGRIQELRQSVASGEYQPDPVAIAKCILFHLE